MTSLQGMNQRLIAEKTLFANNAQTLKPDNKELTKQLAESYTEAQALKQSIKTITDKAEVTETLDERPQPKANCTPKRPSVLCIHCYTRSKACDRGSLCRNCARVSSPAFPNPSHGLSS
ncbi:hypothetical protein BU25DRAFT_230592 [Macroventuria anomochaeta]|uniref:Uncharacterized protein n=1 Tax=Macroventuria anomochaeta TaxID=301207 RepID=A0ACB6RKY1_9PLEO|nr:uncharacterized protein BU25DRAFT_230592 [Macroventuria anomochaeta]KAF2621758.1 hypothetical protein BU25DRAFT_230592 [Macroventuria anomochaeta]